MLPMTHQDSTHVSNVAVGLLKGAMAGAIGVWIMDRVDWFMFDQEEPEARRQTERVRPDGLDPAHKAVSEVADAIGKETPTDQPNAMGVATHYGLGIGPGAAYGALRDRLPAITAGRGSLFGLGLFLTQDEGFNAIANLAASPEEYPWQAHARGCIAHMIYGLVTDSVLRCLDRAGK